MLDTTLSRLDHNQLHDRVVDLMTREREHTLTIIDHLREIDRRRLYRDRGYSSLFTYVTQALGYSTASAVRRISAARAVATHPKLRGMIARREVTLGALSAVARQLTKENAAALVNELCGASIKEAQVIAARLKGAAPLRERIVPMVVARNHRGTPSEPDTRVADCSDGEGTNTSPLELSADAHKDTRPEETTNTPRARDYIQSECRSAQPAETSTVASHSIETRYQLQFSVDGATLAKLQRAMALLSNKVKGRLSTEVVFQMALELLLDKEGPERRNARREQRRKKNIARDEKHCARERGGINAGASRAIHTRHVPRSVKDEVFERDGGRCCYVGPDGTLCGETQHLEIDHIKPFALGGKNEANNLRLLCRTHNQLTAERTFPKKGYLSSSTRDVLLPIPLYDR